MVEIFSLLSRTLTLEKSRKRKRGDDTTNLLFEVRPTEDKNGVGIFSVANIACGDLIISHEEPIVACSARPNLSVCSSCATPVGTLRKDHLKADIVPLPQIFDGTDRDGLIFTTSHTKCRECNDAVWCSSECSKKCQEEHRIFCKSSATLKEFYELEEENAIILRLATMAIAIALSHLTSLSKDKRFPIEQFLWWREYGSHPLWWEVGSSRDGKKDKAVRFCVVLQKALLDSAQLQRMDVEETVIREICSLDNVGSILGMLQCNVMQYEYPSPAGQFLEQVMEEEQFPADDKQPICGSGLYPLLSLANHDCNPNASIEFLQESNRGSMVATRNISVGEEICITYVCNGGVGSGDDAEYFRHFNPTRTWKWLNNKCNDDDDDDDDADDDDAEYETEENCDDPHDDSGSVDVSCASSNNDDCKTEQDEDADDQSLLEGSTVEERAKSLSEYGFHCKCSTCIAQRNVNEH
jgi:hypothetical protein